MEGSPNPNPNPDLGECTMEGMSPNPNPSIVYDVLFSNLKVAKASSLHFTL